MEFSQGKGNTNLKKIMSKKTTTKTATPAKRAVKPAKKTPPAIRKMTAARPATPVPAKALGFTTDDIALRAYFIAEKRRHHRQPGDEQQDWIEAERQLLAESKSASKAVRSRSKTATKQVASRPN